MGESDSSHASADAEATIARQAAEIDRLNRRLADARFADELHQSLMLAGAAGTISAPVKYSRLLEMIVETSAQVISAKAGSLFLLDEEAEELVFEVALGQKADEVKKFRVPLGHGIAGLVAVTGQPMAISDAKHDTRQASDIAEQIDYKPDSILCVPLFYEEQVIGVLELLDKQGAPSFSPQDMEALYLFASLAAVAIEQSRTQTNLSALLLGVLGEVDGLSDAQRQWLRERAGSFAEGVAEDPSYRRTVELAELVHEITAHGDPELEACRSVLHSFAALARDRSGDNGFVGQL